MPFSLVPFGSEPDVVAVPTLSGLGAAACSGGLCQHRHPAASGGSGDPGDANAAPGSRRQILESSVHGGRQVL